MERKKPQRGGAAVLVYPKNTCICVHRERLRQIFFEKNMRRCKNKNAILLLRYFPVSNTAVFVGVFFLPAKNGMYLGGRGRISTGLKCGEDPWG